MNKQAHTPGPWKLDASGCLKAGERGLHLGTFSESAGLGQQAAANAALIAAAPELLRHLRRLVAAIDRAPANFADGLADEARAAIAKAEGQ